MSDPKTPPATPASESSLRALFTLVLVLFLASPLLALASGMLYKQLWKLTLEPQYGSGPTYQSWFGIGLFTTIALQGITKKRAGDEKSVSRTITRIVEGYVGVIVLVLTAICTLGARLALVDHRRFT